MKGDVQVKITYDEINEGRRLYGDFLNGRSGGFYTSLFVAIGRADPSNTLRLAKGFAGCVYAAQEYNQTLRQSDWEIEGESAKEQFERQYSSITRFPSP